MRKLCVIMGLLLTGCVSKRESVGDVSYQPPVYQDKPVSAMVFQHPGMMEANPGFYDREGLAPGAFVAFDQLEATVYEIRMDDRLENSEDGWMYRRAISRRMGVSYR